MMFSRIYTFIFDRYGTKGVANVRTDKEITVDVNVSEKSIFFDGASPIQESVTQVDMSELEDEDKAKIANAIMADLGLDVEIEFKTQKVARLS